MGIAKKRSGLFLVVACLVVSAAWGRPLKAGNCTSSSQEAVNVVDPYYKPQMPELFDMASKLEQIRQDLTELKTDKIVGHRERTEKLEAALEQVFLAMDQVHEGLQAAIQARRPLDYSLRNTPEQHDSITELLKSFEASFLQLKLACGKLYVEAALLYQLNKELGVAKSIKRAKLKKAIIDMAEMGNIMILP